MKTTPIEICVTVQATLEQRCIVRLPHPMTQEEINAYVRATLDERCWNYKALQEETLVVHIGGKE